MRGELLEAERSHSIVGAFYDVYNYFGYGLSEAVYAGALEHELRDRGHTVVQELIVLIYYKGRVCRAATARHGRGQSDHRREQGNGKAIRG